MKQKTNVCGIVGLSTGWFIPIAGVVLGIIALARKEPNKVLGILAIIESLLFWMVWYSIL